MMLVIKGKNKVSVFLVLETYLDNSKQSHGTLMILKTKLWAHQLVRLPCLLMLKHNSSISMYFKLKKKKKKATSIVPNLQPYIFLYVCSLASSSLTWTHQTIDSHFQNFVTKYSLRSWIFVSWFFGTYFKVLWPHA